MSEELPISLENEARLLELAQLIKLARGFRLGIVKCNQPIQRRLLAERLRKMLAKEVTIAEIELEGPVRSLREALTPAPLPQGEGRGAIFIYGFEHSVPSEGPAPALEALNFSRELYPREFPYPFVLWLPDYAVTRLAREAPDFWAWRSGVYEFAPEREVMEAVAVQAIYTGETASLPLEAKRERLHILRGLLEDLAELPSGEREERIKGDTLLKAGIVHYELGEYEEARRRYKEAFSIFEKLGEEGRLAGVLHQLGMLAQDTGDYAEARRLYQESLKIAEELDDRSGIASTTSQLGILERDLGNYAKSAELHQRSLQLRRELTDKKGTAIDLHQLGVLAQDTGNYAEARRFYQESLKIEEELGDKEGIASTLHQLGNLVYLHGDYAKARKLYQESLKTFEELGDKSDIASSLAQTALLEEQLGNLAKALELITEAEALFQELGSPMMEQARRVRERLESSVNE